MSTDCPLKPQRRNLIREGQIERIDFMRDRRGFNVGPPYPIEVPHCTAGITQTFAMYIHPYREAPYGRPIVRLTRVGGLVSLESFYDMGRLPVCIGWGYGRVMWTALRGSKWLNIQTWSAYRMRVFIRDNGTCKRCGKVIAVKDEEGYWPYQPAFVCDHVVPLCAGGKDWYEDPEMKNFQTLCEDCNKLKTREDMVAFHAEQRVVRAVGNSGAPLTAFLPPSQEAP